MDNKKEKICKESPVTTVFFIIGLIATIAIRAIGISGLFNIVVTKILWYIGVLGFLLFFIYKYKVENERRKMIIENNIIKKIILESNIDEKDKEVLSSLLCGFISKKDTINYFVIFFTSAVSLIIALVFDLKILK